MSKTKSSNELVAKLFETIENKFKDNEHSSDESDSSDSDDSSESLSISLSSSDEKSKTKSSSKKSKKTKKKKKKKSSRKKKRRYSSDSSSEDSDSRRSKRKKKKLNKDKVKEKDDKEALHKKLKLVRHRPGLDDVAATKRRSSLENSGVASKKAKLDKSSEKSKLGVDDAILGAIEKEMTTNASQTISEILDDLLGSDRTKIDEKKLLEDSLKNITIKKEKDDSTNAIKIKKEKVDAIKKEKIDEMNKKEISKRDARNNEKSKKANGKESRKADKEERKRSSRRREKSAEKEKSDKSKTDDKEEEAYYDDDAPLPPVADVFVEDLLASKAAQEIAKAKANAEKQVKPSKITIGNLKKPTVFKQVEDAEKQRRSKYEDGEITPSEGEDDDDDNSTDKEKRGRKKKKSKKHRNYRTRDISTSRSRDRSSKSSSSRHQSSRHSSHSLSYRHRSPSWDRSRERERDRDRERDRRSKRHGRDRRRSRSLSLSLSPESRRRSRSPIDSSSKIDKKKLLEIARKNAASMMVDGDLVGKIKKKFDWRMAGKSVEEITEYCKSLSKKGEAASDSSESESSNDEPAFHHPFEIKQRPDHIVMNIRNAMARQTRTFQEKTVESSKQLSLQFPVSSGSQHRRTESEWVPVVTSSNPAIMPPPTTSTLASSNSYPDSTSLNFSSVAMPGAPPLSIAAAPQPVAAPVQEPPTPLSITGPIAPPGPPVFAQPDPEVQNMDIGSVVAERLKAMRRLAENPHDSEAQMQLYHAQKKMQAWAESKQMPGQFTGSTEVRILTPQELAGGSQAWARKEQFETAAPVRGGMGMHLLQKMGWQPGEGLGKNKEGTLEPLAMDIKLDKRGLVAKEEMPQPKKNPFVYRRGGGMGPGGPMGPPRPPMPPRKPVQMSLDGKHPVSLLHEYCIRRKLGVPSYEMASEEGPPHRKMFIFKEILPLILATRQPKKSSLIAQRLISLSQGEDPGENNIAEMENERYDPNSQQEDECQIIEEYDDSQPVNNSTENCLPFVLNKDYSDDIFKSFTDGPPKNDRFHYTKNNKQGNAESKPRDSLSNNKNIKNKNKTNNSNVRSQPSDSLCGIQITTVHRTDVIPKNKNTPRPKRSLIPITDKEPQKDNTRTTSLRPIRLSNDEQMLPDSTNSFSETSDFPFTPSSEQISNPNESSPIPNHFSNKSTLPPVILSIATNKKLEDKSNEHEIENQNENSNEQASSTTEDKNKEVSVLQDLTEPSGVAKTSLHKPSAKSSRRLYVKTLYDTKNRTALDSLLSRIMSQSTLCSDDLLAISEIYEARKCLALGKELWPEPKSSQPVVKDQMKAVASSVDQSINQKKSVSQPAASQYTNKTEDKEKDSKKGDEKDTIQDNEENKERQAVQENDDHRDLRDREPDRDRSRDINRSREHDEKYHSQHRDRPRRSRSPRYNYRDGHNKLPSPRNRSSNDPRNRAYRSPSPRYDRNRPHRSPSPRKDPRYRNDRLPSTRYGPIRPNSPNYPRDYRSRSPRNDPRYRSNRSPSPRYHPRNRSPVRPLSPHCEFRNASLSPLHHRSTSPSPRYNTKDGPPRTSSSSGRHLKHASYRKEHRKSTSELHGLDSVSNVSGDLVQNINDADNIQVVPSVTEGKDKSEIESGEIESGEITDTDDDFSFSDPAKSPIDHHKFRERSRTPPQNKSRSYYRHHSRKFPEHPRDRNVVSEYKPPDVEYWLRTNFPSTRMSENKQKSNRKPNKQKRRGKKQKGAKKESKARTTKPNSSNATTMATNKVLACVPSLIKAPSEQKKDNVSQETKDSSYLSKDIITAIHVDHSYCTTLPVKASGDVSTTTSKKTLQKQNTSSVLANQGGDVSKAKQNPPCQESNKANSLKVQNNISTVYNSVKVSKTDQDNAVKLTKIDQDNVVKGTNIDQDNAVKVTKADQDNVVKVAKTDQDNVVKLTTIDQDNAVKVTKTDQDNAGKVTNTDQNNAVKDVDTNTKSSSSSSPAAQQTKKSNIFTRLDPPMSSESNVLNNEIDKPSLEEVAKSSPKSDSRNKEDAAFPNLGYHSEGEISPSDEDSIYSTSHLIPDVDQVMLQEMMPLMELKIPTPENAYFSPRYYADYPEMYDNVDPLASNRRARSPSPTRSRSPRYRRVSSPDTRRHSRSSPTHHPPHFRHRSSTPPDKRLAVSRSRSPEPLLRTPERIVRRSPTPEEVDLRTLLQSLQAPVGLGIQDELEPIHCAVYGEESHAETMQDYDDAPAVRGSGLKVSVNFDSEETYVEEEGMSMSRHDYRRSSDYRMSEEYRTGRSSDHHRGHRVQRRPDARPVRVESQRDRNTGSVPQGRGNSRGRGARPTPWPRQNTDANNEDMGDELFDPGELFKQFEDSTSDLYNPTVEHDRSFRGHSIRGHNYRGHFTGIRRGSSLRGYSSAPRGSANIRRGGRLPRAESPVMEHLYKM